MKDSSWKPSRRGTYVALAILAVIFALIAVGIGIGVKNDLTTKDRFSYFGQYMGNPREAYNIKLTDHYGAPFELKNLRGHVVLLTFGFTHCPNICPTTLGNLAAVVRALPAEEQKRVKIVFVSIDPTRDNVNALKDYVPFFNEQFIGLTGTDEEVGKAARAYGAFFRKAEEPSGANAEEYMMDHSTYTYLIDPGGNFRVLYHFENMPDTAGVARDVLHVLGSQKPQ